MRPLANNLEHTMMEARCMWTVILLITQSSSQIRAVWIMSCACNCRQHCPENHRCFKKTVHCFRQSMLLAVGLLDIFILIFYCFNQANILEVSLLQFENLLTSILEALRDEPSVGTSVMCVGSWARLVYHVVEVGSMLHATMMCR